MSEREATEFVGRVRVNDFGEWSWRIAVVSGRWPSWLSGAGSICTSGTTLTRWGSKVEARRALKRIRSVVERAPAVSVR